MRPPGQPPLPPCIQPTGGGPLATLGIMQGACRGQGEVGSRKGDTEQAAPMCGGLEGASKGGCELGRKGAGKGLGGRLERGDVMSESEVAL